MTPAEWITVGTLAFWVLAVIPACVLRDRAETRDREAADQ